jgi:hypothetical protein
MNIEDLSTGEPVPGLSPVASVGTCKDKAQRTKCARPAPTQGTWGSQRGGQLSLVFVVYRRWGLCWLLA